MAKAKPNQKIHVEKLQTAFDRLEQLSDKPVEKLTLRESIYFLRAQLHSALKKGYSYHDLSSILAEQDILISAATLKQYLVDLGKKSSSVRKSKSSRKASTSINSSKTVLDPGLSDTQTKKMNQVNTSDEAVNHSLPGTKSSDLADSQSVDKKLPLTKTRARVLSGLYDDDDLKSEFNSF